MIIKIFLDYEKIKKEIDINISLLKIKNIGDLENYLRYFFKISKKLKFFFGKKNFLKNFDFENFEEKILFCEKKKSDFLKKKEIVNFYKKCDIKQIYIEEKISLKKRNFFLTNFKNENSKKIKSGINRINFLKKIEKKKNFKKNLKKKNFEEIEKNLEKKKKEKIYEEKEKKVT